MSSVAAMSACSAGMTASHWGLHSKINPAADCLGLSSRGLSQCNVMKMYQSTIHPHRSKYSNTLYLCSTWLQGPHSADTQHYSLITFHKPLQRLGDRCANPAITACSQWGNRVVLGNPILSLNFKCNAVWWIKGKEALAGYQKGLCLQSNIKHKIRFKDRVVTSGNKKMVRHYRLLLRNKMRPVIRERLSGYWFSLTTICFLCASAPSIYGKRTMLI